MSGARGDEAEKSHEPTRQKLEKARKKGDVARSADLLVAAAYAGLLLAALAAGPTSLAAAGTVLMTLIGQSDTLAPMLFAGSPAPLAAGVALQLAAALAPWAALPAGAVIAALLAQRALVFAPSRLRPKLSRISLIANARNKFGRTGLFEFAKSFVKLVLFSLCLGLLLRARLPEMLMAVETGPRAGVALLARLCLHFLALALLIAAALGAVDALFQRWDHHRRNRMSRKEIADETKDSEGDPQMRQARRVRAQSIAASRMMSDIPTADVVIVNPTHYAVALAWSRAPGAAPVCVAKGVDEIAATIRRIALESGVPVHHDPATARALHATVALGQEIDETHYAPVAAAIRFAERMRKKARERGR